ncbi:hypothetical protein Q4F19_18725 [Sphingomonas sp. BIUV-7]|uniref:Uncharacterized protein n=1 Tax=Sphingomonas natans TaxID=3063330 RepID=A0ABT8YDL8_9SPHN|nr:hypothetical protein [Sphingomonas sp. BIUV-7]MDO6416425.1 hypothetical protein [Sphingomonas sp. BIUV-7]
MLDVDIDDLGILRATGIGHWSIAEVEAYYAKLGTLVAAQRAARRPIRVLIDAVAAELQLPPVQARINAHAERLYEPGDRVAIVVRNNLFKARGRDVAPADRVVFFCSHSAAETWLLAYDPGLRGGGQAARS